MINKIVVFLLITVFLVSCNKFTEDSGVPSFIHIDKIKLNAGVGEGTDSAYIADAWIYIDDDFIGAYELPATFPILKTGARKLIVKPGIILNGISATRTINPFFEDISLNVNLVADSVLHFSTLTTSYIPEANFPWNAVGQEDFEQGGISIDTLTASSAWIEKSKLDVYEGDFSGYCHLNQTNDYLMVTCISDFSLPSSSNVVILELNCRNTASILEVGLYLNLSGGTVLQKQHLYINPGDSWKKLYVNFTDLISQYNSANSFKIYFSSSLSSDVSEADIFIDNIKLVTY